MPAYEKHTGTGLFQIYLAGGLSDWRLEVEKLCADYRVRLIDPFESSDQTASKDFVHQDLEHVRASNVVLAYHDFDPVYGLVMEVTHAYNNDIPTYYVSVQKRPIIVVCTLSRAIFADLEMAVKHILKRHEVQRRS